LIPALVWVFGVGTAGAIVLALSVESRWVWIATFVELVILLHEMSFLLLPGTAWVRVDLILILPLFTLVTAWLAYLGYRKSRGLAVPIILALTALAAPV
jgi:hypothetical protein